MSGGHEKPISLTDAYRVMQEHCGIEKGDTVEVLRGAKDGEMGWDHSDLGLTSTSRGTFTVTGVRPGTEGFILGRLGGKLGGNYYPFFVLKLVEKAKPELPAGVTFTADGLTVGEVYLSMDTIKRNLGL